MWSTRCPPALPPIAPLGAGSQRALPLGVVARPPARGCGGCGPGPPWAQAWRQGLFRPGCARALCRDPAALPRACTLDTWRAGHVTLDAWRAGGLLVASAARSGAGWEGPPRTRVQGARMRREQTSGWTQTTWGSPTLPAGVERGRPRSTDATPWPRAHALPKERSQNSCKV